MMKIFNYTRKGKKKNGFSLIEISLFFSIVSILSVIILPRLKNIIREAEKESAINTIIQIKKECETNSIYGLNNFTEPVLSGYSLEIENQNACSGNPDNGHINLIPKLQNLNPLISYQFEKGLISCHLKNEELTDFPSCKKVIVKSKRYNCKNIGNWVVAQELLQKGHKYLDRDKDGEACETLKRNKNKPKYGKVTISTCYDGDTCTTNTGEKIRLACIDSPELRGGKAEPIAAKESRDFLNNLVSGKEVEIKRVTQDRYGRTVGEIFISGINVQRLLVKDGYAEIYKEYSDPCPWANL